MNKVMCNVSIIHDFIDIMFSHWVLAVVYTQRITIRILTKSPTVFGFRSDTLLFPSHSSFGPMRSNLMRWATVLFSVTWTNFLVLEVRRRQDATMGGEKCSGTSVTVLHHGQFSHT